MSDYQIFIAWLEKTYPTHARAYSSDPVIQSAFFAGMSRAENTYKRMFEAACVDLGMINDCLKLDPNDGGSEPIIDKIREMNIVMQRTIDAWDSTTHMKSVDGRLQQCMEELREEIIK